MVIRQVWEINHTSCGAESGQSPILNKQWLSPFGYVGERPASPLCDLAYIERMRGKPGQLIQLALQRLGAAKLRERLKVTERVLDTWLAGTQPMPESKLREIVALLQPKADK